ncbi:hypothetical protein PR048_032776 [Dryococelus australis]|uniref:C2H2-type domain-containing protein n=1 Tax=Dryococelus australis TaxID=614101 RepID=A0ABQ9G360_9NEOP|nr:hypothetical protein PR048_032776 [Dryococelus australis]
MKHDTACVKELPPNGSVLFKSTSCNLNCKFLTDNNSDCDSSHQTCHICLKVLSNGSGWREQHYLHKTSKVIKCSLCSDCFNDKTARSFHARSEHQNMTVKRRFFKKEFISCKFCDKQMTRKSNLRRHLILFHSQKESENLLCEYCGKMFISEKKFLLHSKDIHLRKVCVECGMCNKKFTSQSILNRHTRTFHPVQSPPKFKCRHCNKIFGSDFELKRHHSRIHLKIKHLCYKCGKVFFDGDDLSAHLKRHAKEKFSNFLLHKNRQSEHKVCEICGKIFSGGCVLNRHIRCVHRTSKNGFRCAKCKKFFRSLAEISTHFKRIHLNVKQSECQICFKKFFDDKALLVHIRNHLDYRPFTCSFCEATFYSNRDMRAHKKIHEDLKLPCSKCGKVFRNAHLLNAHSRYHTGKCKYECASCGAAFVKKASLRDHITTHFATKAFTCEHCDKAFWSRRHLFRHRQVHTENYKCELCGRVCHALPMFEKHVLTHLDKYNCKNCGVEFTAVRKLQEHYKKCGSRENTHASDSSVDLYTLSELLVM